MPNFTDDEWAMVVAMGILLGPSNTLPVDEWNELFKKWEAYFQPRSMNGRHPMNMVDTFVANNGEVGVRLSDDFVEFCREYDEQEQMSDAEREIRQIEEIMEALYDEIFTLNK